MKGTAKENILIIIYIKNDLGILWQILQNGVIDWRPYKLVLGSRSLSASLIARSMSPLRQLE